MGSLMGALVCSYRSYRSVGVVLRDRCEQFRKFALAAVKSKMYWLLSEDARSAQSVTLNRRHLTVGICRALCSNLCAQILLGEPDACAPFFQIDLC